MYSKNIQKLVEIHISEAKKHALQLFAFTSAVFPAEWSSSWNEVVTFSLLEFSFHARKVNELCEFKNEAFPSINQLMVKISENDPGNWETNYHFALNAFIHIKSFIIGQAHADHRVIFPSSSANLQTTYVKIETDKHPEKTISICGLVFCFLNHVIPLLRSKYPDLKF